MDTCPNCGHPKAQHTALVGCLHDGDDICECDRSFKETKTLGVARADRDDAMAKAERGTDPDWEAKATEAVRFLARIGDFSSDNIWERLEDQRVTPPREPRALGPVLKRLAKARVIRAKGFTESRRRHGAPVRVYEAGPQL